MKTLQITIKKARQLYPKASEEFKALLEENFTKKELQVKVTDRIKSYEDACGELGECPLDEAALLNAGLLDHEIAGRKIATITRALNEGWVPDWDNSNQRKWRPWFIMSSSRFAFDVAYCDYSDAFAGDASRLCFQSEELAQYAGKQFTDIYKVLQLN